LEVVLLLLGTKVKFIKIMTLSPELPGSIPLIKSLHQNGTVVSLGHSLATEGNRIIVEIGKPSMF